MPFYKYDPLNYQPENTDKILVVLQPKSPLHSVVYPILEANSSTPLHLLIRLKQNQ